jgi:hypothetical protein
MRFEAYRLLGSFVGGLGNASSPGRSAGLATNTDHTAFSKFIKRAGPETIEKLFLDFLFQAFKMGIIDSSEAIMVSVDSTFMKAYSRRVGRMV